MQFDYDAGGYIRSPTCEDTLPAERRGFFSKTYNTSYHKKFKLSAKKVLQKMRFFCWKNVGQKNIFVKQFL